MRAIVIGASAGGRDAIAQVLAPLPAIYSHPVLVAQHLHVSDGGAFAESLQAATRLTVVSAVDKMAIHSGKVYVAPADYHLLCERDFHVSLSVDSRVHWSRPSIDVLFESAARAWGRLVVAILLTGANRDGAAGLATVRRCGGMTVAQDPGEAECPVMPQSAIDEGSATLKLRLSEIGEFLLSIGDTK